MKADASNGYEGLDSGKKAVPRKGGWFRMISILMFLSLAAAYLLYAGGCSSLYYYPDSVRYQDPRVNGFEYESGFLEVEKGQKVHYWYFPSRGGPAKAVVLHFHGNAQNISSHYSLSSWMANYGYDVMIFDYRGYGQSDGKPDPESTYLDGLAALKEVSRRAESMDVPIIVFAQSLGGAVALRAIVDFPDKQRVALLVDDRTFASYRGIVERKARRILFSPLSVIVSCFFSNAKSPEHVLSNIAPIPVLVMHSRTDGVVEYVNGEEVFSGLKDPRHFYEIPYGGHLGWSSGGSSGVDRDLLEIMKLAVDVYGTGENPFASP